MAKFEKLGNFINGLNDKLSKIGVIIGRDIIYKRYATWIIYPFGFFVSSMYFC
jgi:hypothetical protein